MRIRLNCLSFALLLSLAGNVWAKQPVVTCQCDPGFVPECVAPTPVPTATIVPTVVPPTPTRTATAIPPTPTRSPTVAPTLVPPPLPTLVPTAAPTPPPSAHETGLHSDMTWIGSSWHDWMTVDTKSLKPQVVRAGVLWFQIEKTQGVRDWTQSDSAINHYVQAGFDITMVLGGSPQWLNGSSDSNAIPHGEPAFTNWVNAQAEWAKVAVARYKDRVHKWEIWNEQNDIGFWPPVSGQKVDPNEYIKLYKAVYTAVKSTDPTAKVAMGGLSAGCCTGSQGWGGFDFLQKMYDAGVFPDVVNFHAYNFRSDTTCDPAITLPYQNNFTDIAKIHDIMVTNGQGSKELWVTEWGGWGTEKYTPDQQAQCVGKALAMFRDQYSYVTLHTYFMALDLPGSTWLTGLIDARGSQPHPMKPAGPVFRDFPRY